MAIDYGLLGSGLTGLSQGLLANSGPRAAPVSLGQSFGAGMQGMNLGFEQYKALQAAKEEAAWKRKQEEQMYAYEAQKMGAAQSEQVRADRVQDGRTAYANALTNQGIGPGAGATRPQQARLPQTQSFGQNPALQAAAGLRAGGSVSDAQAMMAPPGPQSPFTLGPGQSRFDSDGDEIASVDRAPEEDPEIWITAQRLYPGDPAKQREFVEKSKLKPLVNMGDKGLSTMDVGDITSYGKLANEAQNDLDTIYQAEQALNGEFETGSFSSFRAGLGRIGVLFGLPMEWLELSPGAVVNADVIQSLGAAFTLKVTGQLQGNISARELTFAQRVSFGLAKTKEGNYALLKMRRAADNRIIEKAIQSRAWYEDNGGSLTGFRKHWRDYVARTPMYSDDLVSQINELMNIEPSDEEVVSQMGDIYNATTGQWEASE
tara:strand:+ start:12570 stop:13862 length:1293 start_codon:yes stop_codon:yes gene_type:complete